MPLKLNSSGGGSVTFDVASTASTYTLTVPAITGTAVVTGSTATVSQAMLGANVTGNGPTFLASQTGAQNISNVTGTVIQPNNEFFDIGGCYNNTGSTATLNGLSVPAWAFMPNIAGYYQINSQVIIASNVGVAQSYIFRNGSVYIIGASGATDGGNCLSTASAVIYCNGTTDYIQSGVWHNAGSTKAVTTGTNLNTFSGVLVRAS